MNRAELTTKNAATNFESNTELSTEARERLRNKAVIYQGVDQDSIDDMINNAESVINEVHAGFKRTIDDQVERAILIIETDVGPDSMARENSDTLYNLIGVINAENPDVKRANELVDEMAIKLATIFNQVRTEPVAEEADFDSRFENLEDRFGPNPFQGLGQDDFGQTRNEDPDDWPNF
jgi:hypothetical protein